MREKMNMVGNPAHLNQMAFLRPDDAANVFVQSSLKIVGDQWRSSLCGEDDVVGQLCECAHDAPFFAPAVPRRNGFNLMPRPHAEAWGYALSSLRERIAERSPRRRCGNTNAPRREGGESA